MTIEGTTYTGNRHASKRGAEHEAAKVALKEMFPDEFAMASQDMSGYGKGKGRGKKRRAEEAEANLNPKSKLNHVLPFILDRGPVKGDLTFEVTEDGEGNAKYVGTCEIKELGRTFSGEPQASKKAAEDAAATAALDELKEKYEPALAEHKEKKQRLKRESLTALKERHAEKLAEKKAAEEGEAGEAKEEA